MTVTDADEKSAKPDKPTLAKITGSSTSLTATWTKPDLNGGPDIAGYDVQYRERPSGDWEDFAHTGTALTTTLTGLTADTSYQARVRAENGETDSDWSEPSDAVRTNAADMTGVPDAPGDLTATAEGETRIVLAWAAPSNDGGSAVTGYRIEVSEDVGLSWTDLVADTAGTDTTYIHAGLSAGTTRHYQVRAINAEGESGASAVAGATTAEERAPEGNEPSAIRTYWTDSETSGSNEQLRCAATERFRAYWHPPLDREQGGVRRYKVAEEWEAEVRLGRGASDVSYTIQNTGDNPEQPELTGSVRIDDDSWLSIRVRGRFGDDGWGGWSPRSSLHCRTAGSATDSERETDSATETDSESETESEI